MKKIFKIGGSNISNLSHIRQLISYFSGFSGIVIVSAFGSYSRETKSFFKAILEDNNCEYTFNNILEKNIIFLSQSLNNKNKNFFKKFLDHNVNLIIKKIYALKKLNEIQEKVLDEALSLGELLSTKLIYLYLLEENINCDLINAFELIKTDSNFGNANVIKDLTLNNIRDRINQNSTKVILTQGFIASDKQNNITTMGFESSNYTAILFAEALNIDEIRIFIKEKGIHTMDPRLNPKTKIIKYLNFNSAKFMVERNHKLLFEGMIKSAIKNNIKFIFTSFENKHSTIIGNMEADLPLFFEENSKYYIVNLNQIYLQKLISEISSNKNISNFKINNISGICTVRLRDEENIEEFAKIHNTLIFSK